MLGDLFARRSAAGCSRCRWYVIVQARAAPDERARMIAANNVLNAGFMVAGSVVAAGLAAWGLGAPVMLRLLAGVNVPVAIAFGVGRWRSRDRRPAAARPQR